MSTAVKITSKTDANQKTDSDLLPRTNDVNHNKDNVSVSASASVGAAANGQKDSSVLINCNESTVQKDKTKNQKSNDKYKSQSTNAKTTNGNNDVTLMRTQARNSCNSINGHNIAKSWYARCNRWRSQSCDRRKTSIVRYSWNTINNRPA